MKPPPHNFWFKRAALFLGLALWSGWATGQTTLSVGNVPAYPGGSLLVPIGWNRASNVVAAQFDLAFDPSRVTGGAALSHLPGSGQIVLSRELSPGVRRVLVFSLQNSVITNRSPVQLPFTVSPSEYISSGPLTPQNAIMARKDGTAVTPVALRSGTIFVRPVNFLPDGHVQFFLPSTPDQRYIIQATTNLVNWVNISTNVASGTFLDLIDVDAVSNPYRFYRWQLAE
jgi:hypothetical protein